MTQSMLTMSNSTVAVVLGLFGDLNDEAIANAVPGRASSISAQIASLSCDDACSSHSGRLSKTSGASIVVAGHDVMGTVDECNRS
jgi:hypothetical protein